MDYIILEADDSHSDLKEGDVYLKRIDFLVASPEIVAKLPPCSPGSRAVNAMFCTNPLDPSAYLTIKQLDGSWL